MWTRPRRWRTSSRVWRWGWRLCRRGSCGCSWCWSRRWRTRLCAVSPTSIQIVAAKSSPHDHLAADPHRDVRLSVAGRVGGVGGAPNVCVWVVPTACVQLAERLIEVAPDDHFTTCPDCCMCSAGNRRVAIVCRCPAVTARIVAAASVEFTCVAQPAPDDHFAPGPHGRVIISGIRVVSGALVSQVCVVPRRVATCDPSSPLWIANH